MKKNTCRLTILFLMCFTFSGLAAEYYVSSASEIKTVMASAKPGDLLIMKNGIWNNQQIIFEGNGTENSPIILRAETPGYVVLKGNSYLRIGGSHLIADGLYFTEGYINSGSVIEFRNGSGSTASNCRLTNTAIVNYNPPNKTTDYKWISLYGKNNRVDHCYLRGKNHSGTTLVVWLSGEPNYHLIDSNYFAYRPELGVNGGETIRIGTSDWSMFDSYTTVEHNYFERCNGETEIISNKSCRNVFRYNTFMECGGTLTLRHGNYAEVYSNFFFGNNRPNTGGVRIIGENHKVYNNYFENLAGTDNRSALPIMNGVPNSPLNRYFQVKNAQVLFNTFINCRQTFVLGAGKDSELSLPPADCLIANNLVLSNYQVITKEDEPINLQWEGNIIYGAPLGITKPEGITIIDPQLHFAEDSLWRPEAGSPAIDAAVSFYPYINNDFDGQLRTGVYDTGADEISDVPVTNKPLKGKDVGASWYPVPPKPPVIKKVSAGQDSLLNIIQNSKSGEIIELITDGGLYPNSSDIQISISLTIRSEKGLSSPPIIQNNASSTAKTIFEIVDGGSLILEGVELDGSENSGPPSKYLIRTDDSPMTKHYSLKINSCYFHDAVIDTDGNFFRAYAGTFADTVIIRNSLFINCGNEGIRLKDEPAGSGKYSVNYFEIENSTFWNTGKEAISISSGDNIPFTPGPAVRINHCTFDNCGYNDAPVINFDQVDNIRIKNTIFSNGSLIQPAVKLYGVISNISYCNFYNTTSFAVERDATSGPGMYTYDPLYKNRTEGDFTLPGNSPMHYRADDGLSIGDLRWAVNPATVYPLNYTVKGKGYLQIDPETEGFVYTPGSSVKITAVASDGYKFGKWNGDATGTNPVINLNIDSVKNITAHFELITGLNESILPLEFNLYQNFPNPFNSNTTIGYSVARKGKVSIKIYDSTGSLIENFVDKIHEPGSYSKNWEAAKYSSGVYLVVMNTESKTFHNKAILLK